MSEYITLKDLIKAGLESVGADGLFTYDDCNGDLCVCVDEPLPPDIEREHGGLLGLLEKKVKLLIECVELLETKVKRLENRSTAGCSCGTPK